MMMRTKTIKDLRNSPIIRLDLSYSGNLFSGYQKQEHKRTVQGELEKKLEIIYKQPVEIFAAGRTDTGVHARQQVISFKQPQKVTIPIEKLPYILNSLLPSDIRVFYSSYENPSFHARFSAKTRTYQYIIHNTKHLLPFDYLQKWYYTYPLDTQKLTTSLQFLVGENHFGSFTEKPSTQNLIRTIYSIKVDQKGEYLYITIHGNAFLRRMIRIIIGTAVSIASYPDVPIHIMKDILLEKNRNKNPFPTAPPQGLYFYQVEY